MSIEFVNPHQYTVNLTYFRATGKFYTDGTYQSTKENIIDIWHEIRYMDEHPGLSSHWTDIILVDIPDHPHNHPKLLMMENII